MKINDYINVIKSDSPYYGWQFRIKEIFENQKIKCFCPDGVVFFNKKEYELQKK